MAVSQTNVDFASLFDLLVQIQVHELGAVDTFATVEAGVLDVPNTLTFFFATEFLPGAKTGSLTGDLKISRLPTTLCWGLKR